MNNSSINYRISKNLDETFLHRPRLVRKIEDGFQKNATVVVAAGAGYGKTSAVMDYFYEKSRDVIWLPLTENDSSPAIFWNNWFSVLSDYNRDVYNYMSQFDFPDTSQKFNEYWDAIAECVPPSAERHLVFDDVHCIDNSESGLFFSRSFANMSRYAKIIIITRRMLPWFPEKYTLLAENDLRLTEDEVYDMFALRDVNCPVDFLQSIWRESEGWTFALNLLSLKLRQSDQPDEYFIRNSLLKNIFSYFDREVFSGLTSRELRLLHTINITWRMALSYFEEHRIGLNPLVGGFLHLNPQKDLVELHPLIAEYLRAHPIAFTDEELRAEYRQAANWCLGNNQRMLAMKYFSAAADYKPLVDNGVNEPLFMPRSRAEFYGELIEKLTPDETDADYCLVRYVYYVRVLLSLRRFDEAAAEIAAVIKRFSGSDSAAVSPLAARMLASSYLSLAYLRHYICPLTRQYDFDHYAALAREWFVRSGIEKPVFFGPYNNAPVRTYNCLVGEDPAPGEFQRYLAAVRNMVASIGQCLKGMYAGYDLLCEGEYLFRRNDLARSRELITAAMTAAKAGHQYAILTYALQLYMRICVGEGDAEGVDMAVKTYDELLNNEKFAERSYYCYMMRTWLYIQTGMFNKVPAWLKLDGTVREKYAWIVEADEWMLARYYLKSNEPDKILTMFYVNGGVEPVDRTYMGQLDRAVVVALALFKTGRREKARAQLTRCYQIARREELTMPFIEFGTNMAELCEDCLMAGTSAEVAAAGPDTPALSPNADGDDREAADETIPHAWLEQIRVQSVAYAKKLAYVTDVLFRKNSEEAVTITPREKNILVALYQGLSREEIATSLHISLNTVKTNMSNLFIRIGAKNSIDAVRYGLEKGILK